MRRGREGIRDLLHVPGLGRGEATKVLCWTGFSPLSCQFRVIFLYMWRICRPMQKVSQAGISQASCIIWWLSKVSPPGINRGC